MDQKRLAELLYPNVKEVQEIEKTYPERNLPKGAEVTRFAPSPTGYLHIGHFFSALIDYQIALSSGGVFYFRCEDTDKKREIEGADKIALEMLKTLKVYPTEGWLLDGERGDYGPYKQSERVEIYKAYAKKLVSEGKAFPCFCKKPENLAEVKSDRAKRFDGSATNEEYDPCRNLTFDEIASKIEIGEKFALRLKTHGKDGDRIKVRDVQKGEVEMQANAKDVVLMKENGIPPYAFAHPIDDHLMKTTLVVRGEEWLPSAPAHLEIFEALGFAAPKYFHTPLISKLNEKGGREKLSKRKHPEADMRFFVKEGYPVDGIKEYILNLISSDFEPWRTKNPTDSLSDFKISAGNITAVMPIFDIVKLNDVSKNVIARMNARQVYAEVLKWAESFSPEFASKLKARPEYCVQVFNIDREGPKPRKDIFKWGMIEEYFSYMFHSPKIDGAAQDKKKFERFISAYLREFTFPEDKDSWFAQVKEVAGKLGYALDNKVYKQNPDSFEGNVAKACEHIRIALTGRKDAPDLFTLITILGKDEVVKRLKDSIK